jgi:hypothetical protein
MRNLLMACCAAAAGVLAVPGSALAQAASAAETGAVQSIVECLGQGLPAEFKRAEMIVELATPGAKTGDVQYVLVRGEPEQLQSFTPCDLKKPARLMLELRERLAVKRRGWIKAHLVVQPDGKFSLNYEYPKVEDSTTSK